MNCKNRKLIFLFNLKVEQIRNELEKQILEDFHNAFHGPNSRRFAPTKVIDFF